MNDRILQLEHDHIACPRCGYDLRGAVATWRESCPLTGTCTECGLALDWAAVVVPWKFEPTWCVEFARQRVPRAAVVTLLRSFRPIKFWKAHDMSHRVRWRRLLVYALFLFVVVLTTYLVERTAVSTRAYFTVKQGNIAMQARLQSYMATAQANLASIEAGEGEFTSEERTQRIAAYKLAIQSQMQTMNTMMQMPITLKQAIVDAITRPISSMPPGVTANPLAIPYPAPLMLYETIGMSLNPRTGRGMPVLAAFSAWVTIVGVLSGWSAWLFMPFGFALLPISRRRAKVRWVHVLRAWVYSLWIPAIAVASTLLCLAFAYGTTLFMEQVILLAGIMFGVFVLVATLIWWRAAICHYMHVPHGWAIVVLLAMLATLLALAVILTAMGVILR